MKRFLFIVLLGVAALFPLSGALAQESGDLPATSCTTCHADVDLFDEEQARIVGDFSTGVHAEIGISCHDCHGGNPDLELAEDLFSAKDEELAEHPYRGMPGRTEIPGLCASCHSDPAYMRRFKPDARVDQEAEYRTSEHGKALALGDTKVATCTDCHGIHGIQRVAAPDSTVHPTRVAETCSGCHSDPAYMRGYTSDDGSQLPTDQHARWSRSVHAASMFEREDLSAPTCNDCHGNHGAAPPGLDSVTFVCGQCHGREAEIFRSSPKHFGFEAHNEYMADAGDEGCYACHDEEPKASLEGVVRFGECASCHGNHGVIRPTVAMYAALPETPCAFCHEAHEGSEAAAIVPEPERILKSYQETLADLREDAEAAGIKGVDLFDHFVDQAQQLSFHTLPAVTGEEPTLRPEFAELFAKFRIGKTYYTYTAPSIGDGSDGDAAEELVAEIPRCSTCHSVEGEADDLSPGATNGAEVVRRLHDLTVRTARAERILLAARRGGVETREALAELDQAVDAQIGLQVLAHTFSTEEGGLFMERYEEGLENAEAALDAGNEALGELTFRRKGLGVALLIILLVLIALGAKIREISARVDPPS